jgi:hypothetical protein
MSLRVVRPTPQRLLDPNHPDYVPGLSDYAPGGKYLDADTLEDLTGKSFASAIVTYAVRSAHFEVADEIAAPPGREIGPIVRFNIIRKSVGWAWVKPVPRQDVIFRKASMIAVQQQNIVRFPKAGHYHRDSIGWCDVGAHRYNLEDVTSLVSIETGGKHFYAVRAVFRSGLTLTSNPTGRSEPRLRPTARGVLAFGKTVEEINLRGKTHPVYDVITVQRKPPTE